MGSQTQTVFVRRVHFSCGHRYANPEFSEEKNRQVFGACYSPHGHGHNYALEAHFTGPIDPQTGMVLNLVQADKLLEQISQQLDHQFLNEDVEHFKTNIPTTENMAVYVFDQLAAQLEPPVELLRVRLYECEDIWAEHGKADSAL